MTKAQLAENCANTKLSNGPAPKRGRNVLSMLSATASPEAAVDAEALQEILHR